MKGAKDCVEAAAQRIKEIVGDLESQVTIECKIEQVLKYLPGVTRLPFENFTTVFDFEFVILQRL